MMMIGIGLSVRVDLVCLIRVAGDVGEDEIEGVERNEKGGWSGALGILRPCFVPGLMRRSFFHMLCFSVVT